MEADMNSIMVGYRGMQDMLGALFGKSEPGPAQQPIQVRQQPMSRPPGPVQQPVMVINPAVAAFNSVDVEQLPKLSPSAFDRMFSDVKGKPN